MTIIADENIPNLFVAGLRNLGFDVLSIHESHRGTRDQHIIEIVRHHSGILLTEDKDFGEWVFAHGVIDISVIFLRYNKHERTVVFDSLQKTLKLCAQDPVRRFITITGKKIRSRSL